MCAVAGPCVPLCVLSYPAPSNATAARAPPLCLQVVDHQRLSGAGYCFSASAPPFTCAIATKSIELLEVATLPSLPYHIDQTRSPPVNPPSTLS